MLNYANYKSFSELFSVCLKLIDALNLKLLSFCMQTAHFKFRISKVQDFGNFELSPRSKTFVSILRGYSGPRL